MGSDYRGRGFICKVPEGTLPRIGGVKRLEVMPDREPKLCACCGQRMEGEIPKDKAGTYGKLLDRVLELETAIAKHREDFPDEALEGEYELWAHVRES